MKQRGHDYFFGYIESEAHPSMAATGTEGRCELCGGYADDVRHREPYWDPPTRERRIGDMDGLKEKDFMK